MNAELIEKAHLFKNLRPPSKTAFAAARSKVLILFFIHLFVFTSKLLYRGKHTPKRWKDRHIRNQIIEAVRVAIRIDPVMQNYYRSHAGKNSKAVIFKVGRKLLSKILAVIKTEIPYSTGVVE